MNEWEQLQRDNEKRRGDDWGIACDEEESGSCWVCCVSCAVYLVGMILIGYCIYWLTGCAPD